MRRLAGLENEKVHFQEVTMEEISGEDAFLAGMKMHSLVDIVDDLSIRLEA